MKTSEMIDLTLLNQDALQYGKPRTPAMRSLTNLRNACDVFSRRCWQDIRKIHKASNTRGLMAAYVSSNNSGDTFEIKILTYCIAGRIMVTLKNDNEDFVTLCGGESKEDSIGGLHAIDCDPDVALDMLEIMEQRWYCIYDQRGANNVNKFKSDREVHIAGFPPQK